MPPIEANEIEQIAMFAGRGIGPMTGTVAGQPEEQAAAGRALDIAGDPVTAMTASGRQIGAADRLGLAGETARKFGCGAHGTSRRGFCAEADRSIGG